MALTELAPNREQVKAAMDIDFHDWVPFIEARDLKFGRQSLAAVAALQHEVTRLRALLPPGA